MEKIQYGILVLNIGRNYLFSEKAGMSIDCGIMGGLLLKSELEGEGVGAPVESFILPSLNIRFSHRI